MRFLLVMSPFIAHTNPAVSVAQELSQRGHEVAWVLHENLIPILPDNARNYPPHSDLSAEEWAEIGRRSGRTTFSGFKSFFEEVVLRLAGEMLPTVESAIRDFRPDVVFADQHAFAGSIAARKHGLVWSTSAATAQPLTRVLEQFPLVKRWLVDSLNALASESGLEPIDPPDLSPHLVVLYTSRDFCDSSVEIPNHYRFVGPAIERRPDRTDFDWSQLNKGQKLYVTLGTISNYRGEKFLKFLAEAVRGLAVQAIVSAPPELVPDPPDNMIVKRWLPQVPLLAQVDAVVCHAGYSTQMEVLANGLPSVVAPIAYDSSIVAQLAVNTGTAVRLRFQRTNAGEIRDAIKEVMEVPSYREAAQRLKDSLLSAGGAVAAANALEAAVR